MPDAPPPRGLHRRQRALQRRADALESAVAARQAEFASTTATTAPRDAAAGELAALQAAYDDAVAELASLRAMARRLRDWGLSPADTASWAAVCRALRTPARPGAAHRAVRRDAPVLHVLLHRFALPPHCPLDNVTYAS